MKTIQGLQQGSDAWLAHRRTVHNASEASVMMGAFPTFSRRQLVKVLATGLEREFSDYVQERILDRGHEVEPALRAYAERMIEDELYPVTAVSDDGYLGASFDGITMSEDVILEAKQYSAAKAEYLANGVVPPQDYWQVVQQFAVCESASRCLYLVGDGTDERTDHLWIKREDVEADILKLRPAWKQFDADVFDYVPGPEELPAPAGKSPDQLPALHIELTGMVTASNLAEYKDHAIAVFRGIKTDLQTDQDFADAEKAVKFCSDIESRIEAAKQHALSQTATIDELFRALDSVKEEARSKRLELDKLVKSRKESIRSEIAYAGRDAIAAHYDTMNATLGEHRITLPASIGADLNAAIKGKRTVSSIRDAVDGVVAQHKIAASQRAEQVLACMAVLADAGAGHETLFADRVALCALARPDDLRNLIKVRIADHEAKERQRIENEREKIRAEEAAKLQAEQAAKAAQEAQQAAPAPAAPVAPPVASPALVAAPARRTPVTKSRPTDREIIDVLTLHFRVHDSKVIEWLLDMDLATASKELAA